MSRLFEPGYDHAAIAIFLRRQAMKGFQTPEPSTTGPYVESCSCGVNLAEGTNSVSLILTRDKHPDYVIGWHLSVCCVTDRGYRGYVPEEGEHWRRLIFGRYADRAIEQPRHQCTWRGIVKDVHHFVIECDWDRRDPAVRLEGLLYVAH